METGHASLIPPLKAEFTNETVEHQTKAMVCFDIIRHFEGLIDINIRMFRIYVI